MTHARIRFLYLFIIMLDACFRLSRRLVSSCGRDPGLGTGLSYFVPDVAYREHLLNYTDQKDVRKFIISNFCFY